MNDFELKIIENIRKIMKHGWGKMKITISADGKRKHVFYGFDDIEEEKKVLDTDKKV